MLLVRSAALSVGALLVAATAAVFPASAQAAVPVPKDCGVWTAGYQSNGQRVAYGIYAGKNQKESLRGDTLTWVPKALQQWGAAGDDRTFNSADFAVHPNGTLYDVYRVGNTTKLTKKVLTKIGTGYSDTRALVNGGDYLYRLTKQGLYRYTIGYGADTPRLTARKTVAASGWSGVKTLIYDRTEGSGAAKVDVLLGTTSSGALKEYKVNRTTPSKVTSKVLRASGWGSFTSISTGYCDQHPKARPILAITSTGKVYAYFDKVANDGKGTDITGGPTGATGATAKAYGQ